MMRLVCSLLLLSFIAGQAVAADGIAEWESLAAKGQDSRVFFNLGAAYSAAGESGKAVLNLKRAVLLSPGDREAYELLAAEREKLGFPRHLFESTPLEKVLLLPFTFIPVNAMAWVGMLLFTAGCGLLGFLFSRIWNPGFPGFGGKNYGRFRNSGWLAFGVGLLLIISSVLREAAAMNPNEAVVMQKTQLLVMPETNAAVLGELLPGMECQIRRQNGVFSLIRTAAGQEGWLQYQSVVRLWAKGR